MKIDQRKHKSNQPDFPGRYPQLPSHLTLQSGTRTVAWVSAELTKYLVVYAADNTFLIALRDPRISGGIEEMMEAFLLGIGGREILRGSVINGIA